MNPTNPESLPAVTQEDREAAKAFLAEWPRHGFADYIEPALAEAFARHRPAHPAQPGREDVVEAMARAICAAASETWRSNEGLSAVSIENLDRDALNNRWRHLAKAALSAAEPLLARQDGPEAEELLHELNNLPIVHKGVQFDGWLLSEPTLKAILAALSTLPTEPASVREERLREALEEAEIVLALVEEPALADPYALIEVRELGDRIGYGNLMNTASEIWRSKLDPSGGEFVAGPCRATVNRCLKMIRAALSTEELKL